MTGIELITAERQRQIEVEGWTHEHDDKHTEGQLRRAAGWYALNADACNWHDVVGVTHPDSAASALFKERDGYYSWPFAREWFRPTGDTVRDLVKAGALIAAEIDRIQRAS